MKNSLLIIKGNQANLLQLSWLYFRGRLRKINENVTIVSHILLFLPQEFIEDKNLLVITGEEKTFERKRKTSQVVPDFSV